MGEQLLTYTANTGSQEGTVILSLDGPLVLANLFVFQSELREFKPPVLILDFAQVPYMDSAGLGVVMNSYVSMLRGGRKLLVAGVNGRVAALLELTKVNRVLSCFPSVLEAEESL